MHFATKADDQIRPRSAIAAQLGAHAPDALSFLTGLHETHEPRRRLLMAARQSRQELLDAGEMPDFRADTADIRDGGWRVAPAPADLRVRTVELVTPAEPAALRKARDSGADVLVADLDDLFAGSPAALPAALETLAGLCRTVGDAPGPALMLRPQGLHVVAGPTPGRPAMAACILQAGLFLLHGASALLAAGRTPALVISKLEGAAEAGWWNDLLSDMEARLGLPHGSVRVTASIDTLPAAFEMDEILHALRGRALGLQCGRASFLFSYVKRLRAHRRQLSPLRSAMVMGANVLASLPLLMVRTCHRRGAHAIGCLAAELPVPDDHSADDVHRGRLRADKVREAADGFDGTWVADASQATLVRQVFAEHHAVPDQVHRLREDVDVIAADLLSIHPGRRSEHGVRDTLQVALACVEARLEGRGCVSRNGFLEDAAEAELARTQLWQWVRHGAALADGRPIDAVLVKAMLAAEVAERPDATHVRAAVAILEDAVLAPDLPEFLFPLPA
jgi:malate synthase